MNFFYHMGEKIKADPELKLNVNDMHVCGIQCNDGTYRMRKNEDLESIYRYMFNSKSGNWIIIEGKTKCKCDFSAKLEAKQLLNKLNEDYKNVELDYNEQLSDIIYAEILQNKNLNE